MTTPAPARSLRLWPGVTVAVLIILLRYALPEVAPDMKMFAMLAGVAGAVLVVLWWLFFSRALWLDRLAGIALLAGTLAATPLVLHESIRTGGMGFMFPILAVPIVALAFVAWAVAARHLSSGLRRATMVGTVVLACGVWALLRTEGVTGGGDSQLAWRWTPTAEERLLALGNDLPAAPAPMPPLREAPAESAAAEEPTAPAAAPPTVEPASDASPRIASIGSRAALVATHESLPRPVAEWPGFRGPHRNSMVSGMRIETDWSTSPPVELWRRPVGPGWSSFAVAGDFIYTQEQRGDEEVVSCYHATTGEPVWRHRDSTRFWESNAGAGPRATPTLHGGRVYTLGATGILNALDARDGSAIWSRNATADTDRKVPDWGIASSPLVVRDMLVVATAGVLAAYDLATGDPRWIGPKGGWGYGSPHLTTIDGVEQIVLLNGAGAIGVAPADGAVLWQHEWRGDGILQPAIIAGSDVLIGSGSGLASGVGIRRVSIAHAADGWAVEERWTSRGLKPYFSDFVVHNGHAFGFDGRILACIDLADGARTWKGGRYGHGQLVLLPDQDLLLILSEDGELALVRAATDQFTELARMPGIEGKTWNHPVLAGDVLLVRNDREMAAFRLATSRP